MSIQYNKNTQPVMQTQMQIPAGDPLSQLPVDKTPPSQNEIHIIDTLFKKHRGTMDIIFEEAKGAIIVGLLVVLFCLPNIDTIIQKFLPITQKSLYFLLVVKGLIASVIYWLVKHFYLSRKS
jgi:hypothetical protein